MILVWILIILLSLVVINFKKAIQFGVNIYIKTKKTLYKYPVALDPKDRLYYHFDQDVPIVMIGSYKYAKELYTFQKKLYRDHSYFGYVYDILFKECIGTKYGEIWLEMKKPLDQYFSGGSVKKYYDELDECIDQWFSEKFNSYNVTVRLGQLGLNMLTMKFLVIMGFGRSGDEKILQELSELHEKVVPLLNSPLRYGIKLCQNEEINLVRQLYVKWVEFINIMDNSELITHLMHHQNQIYDQKKLIHTLYELIMFNADVMINAITYLIWDIGSHADVQERLINNLDDAEYLNKVIIESARLHPGVLTTFTDTNSEEIIIGNYKFPPKTLFSLDTKMINTDSNIWDNPNKFNPNRITEDSINKVFRFGMGQRKCIGRISADIILKKVITKIFSMYRVEIMENNINIAGSSVLSNLANGNSDNVVRFIKY